MDEETYERWHQFASQHGLDVSYLIEAIGRKLPVGKERVPAWLYAVIVEARAVRTERRNRRPID